MLRRFPILLVMFFTICLPAPADEASKTAKIKELLELTHSRDTIKQVLDLTEKQIRSNIVAQLMNSQPTAEQQKDLDAFEEKVMVVLRKSLSWEQIEPEMVKIYQEAFSETELDGIVSFYQSPAGRAMVTKMPDILTKASAIGQQRVQASLPELQRLMQDFAAQERAKKK